MAVVGPTASGKTALAVALAQAFGGEVVSFDSMQMYRGFTIGTAQPGATEQGGVRHHFIGECDPRQPLTAGAYSREARPRILEILGRGRLPVLAGGTGLYLRALLEGLFTGPDLAPEAQAAMRQRLRARAARHGAASLHRLLERLDPAAAARIAPRDAARAIRALEVRLLTGRPISEWWARHPPAPFAAVRPLLLGLAPPRAELYRRIDARARAMFCPP
ncbi:MAG: tRNA (adenosine(37)-N6)-dimethylallyltransferase MiaA, partial [Terriglobales bacterium]